MLLVIVLQVGYIWRVGCLTKLDLTFIKEEVGFFFSYIGNSLVVQLYVPVGRLLYF